MYERFSTAPATISGDAAGSSGTAAGPSGSTVAGQIIDADFVPVESSPEPPPAAEPPADAGDSALSEVWQALSRRLRLDQLSIDDLLLIGILILILRRSAEWDVLLIMGILFFLGLFDDAAS